jgi:V/A-type H+-transporting ATPase subunit F
MSDIAVLCSSDEFTLFKAIKADVFEVAKSEAAEKLVNVGSQYKIVLIDETLAEIVSNQIRRMSDSLYPIVLVLPNSKGTNGVAVKNLVRKAREALGIDIFKEF